MKSALSIYTDSGYNNALASHVIKSVAFAGVDKATGAAAGSAVGSGTVTIELDQTYLQGQGVSDGDTLYLRYSAADADDVLVDASSNDVDPFEVSFTANMSNMPELESSAYDSTNVDRFEINFTNSSLKTDNNTAGSSSTLSEADKALVLSQFKLYEDESHNNVITNAVNDISILNDKIVLSFDRTLIREASVEDSDRVYLRFVPTNTFIASSDSTQLGSFSTSFDVKLPKKPNLHPQAIQAQNLYLISQKDSSIHQTPLIPNTLRS